MFFQVFDLSNIAIELDKEEQALMLGGDIDPEVLQALEPEPSNVCLDGNFSIQVLRKALTTFGVDMVRFNSEEGIDLLKITPPEQQQGYICNFNDHWFGIRKIKGKFYNLDSLKKKPVVVSDTYLRFDDLFFPGLLLICV
jgi:ataxin-3